MIEDVSWRPVKKVKLPSVSDGVLNKISAARGVGFKSLYQQCELETCQTLLGLLLAEW